jgi:membrane-associated PAP2 superfamily phosphatase
MKTPSTFSGGQVIPLLARLCNKRSTTLLIPLAALILMSLIINFLNLDRRIADRLFIPGVGWSHAEEVWVQLFYHFGCWPAVGVAVVALVLLVRKIFHPPFKRVNRLAVFLLLLLALGPGLIVNGIFKPHFGRPRPKQVVAFDGKHAFQPVLILRLGEGGHSFPCGHASMGFYWIGLFVYWRKTHRWRSLMCLAAGIAHGGAMGAGRMLQGAHWFSDVIWSAGFIYLTALFLCRFEWFQPQSDYSAETSHQKHFATAPEVPVIGSDAAAIPGTPGTAAPKTADGRPKQRGDFGNQ